MFTTKIRENIIQSKIDLIVLNLLYYLDTPDDNFHFYLKEMSTSYDNQYFDHSEVLELKNRYLDIFNNLKTNDKYFKLNHSGICQVIDQSGKKIEYKSLFIPRGKIDKSKAKW